MSTTERWKIIISGGRFVVVDSSGTQITAHHDIREVCEQAREIARQRGVGLKYQRVLQLGYKPVEGSSTGN